MINYFDNLTDKEKALLGFAVNFTSNEIMDINNNNIKNVPYSIIVMHVSANILSLLDKIGQDEMEVASIIKISTKWFEEAKDFEKQLKEMRSSK